MTSTQKKTLAHAARQVAAVVITATVTYAASPDFRHLVSAHPQVAAYVPFGMALLTTIERAFRSDGHGDGSVNL